MRNNTEQNHTYNSKTNTWGRWCEAELLLYLCIVAFSKYQYIAEFCLSLLERSPFNALGLFTQMQISLGIMLHPSVVFRINLSKSAFQKGEHSGELSEMFSTAPKTLHSVFLTLPCFLCLCTSKCHTCLFLNVPIYV